MTAEAIPAATLVVVRDRTDGAPELLMVERAEGMAFAGGALVFPGGRIDDGDRALGERFAPGSGGAAIAAIRETIEEAAIPVGLEPPPGPDEARRMQRDLLADQSFGHLLDAQCSRIDAAALVPFARWVPQFHAVRRFDTMFFLARAPHGDWRPNVVEGECSGAYWLSAAEVLERDRNGSARLIFPTRRTLERLALHQSFGAMAADAAAHPVEPITPWVEEHEGEKFVTIPTHLGFPVTRERLEGLWRG